MMGGIFGNRGKHKPGGELGGPGLGEGGVSARGMTAGNTKTLRKGV